MSVLEKLTEGIVNRDMKKEGAALLSKWEKTGLLEGLGNEGSKHTMSRLLENQAKELLREASTMSAGDVEGFAAVAFPIVRRVFGGLIANELVSVQPMSLPSGLIFFLDFTYTDKRTGAENAKSLYGGGVVGQEVTGGALLAGHDGTNWRQETGFYALNNGYASPTGSVSVTVARLGSGTFGLGFSADSRPSAVFEDYTDKGHTLESLCQWDPDLSGTFVTLLTLAATDLDDTSTGEIWNKKNTVDIDFFQTAVSDTPTVVRRLTRFNPLSGSANSLGDGIIIALAQTGTALNTWAGTVNGGSDTEKVGMAIANASVPLADDFGGTAAAGAANAIGAVVGQDTWGLENNTAIPEIDLKVDSVSVTAVTKKLKAKWTPELGQDLNAYHNLDAEVELTSILSEQIALEIDREILQDLMRGATASKLYWARSPGLFVNRETGQEVGASAAAPDFTGTVSEWYETLLETVNDVSANIHRKTLRGGANFLVCSPEVASILEFTAGFRASVTVDENKGVAGAEKIGNLSKKFDVYVDPYFPRNVVLVGRKGNSFLESGYVYAPYVPLQVTPRLCAT